MSKKSHRIAYVDRIAPKHCRKSCSDTGLLNAAIDTDDNDGMGRCYRCTLLLAATIDHDIEQGDDE